jgi:hypothetical protein
MRHPEHRRSWSFGRDIKVERSDTEAPAPALPSDTHINRNWRRPDVGQLECLFLAMSSARKTKEKPKVFKMKCAAMASSVLQK